MRYRAASTFVDGALRYPGSATKWGFAIYRTIHDDDQNSSLSTALTGGTSEDGLDTACGLYLADPKAWT